MGSVAGGPGGGAGGLPGGVPGGGYGGYGGKFGQEGRCGESEWNDFQFMKYETITSTRNILINAVLSIECICLCCLFLFKFVSFS